MTSNLIQLITEEKTRRSSSINLKEILEELSSRPSSERSDALKRHAKDHGISARDLTKQLRQWRIDQALHQGECPYFVLTDEGLYEKDEFDQPGIRLTGPLRIVGGYSDQSGHNSGLEIEILQPLGRDPVRVKITRAYLAGDAKEAIRQLLDGGLELTAADGAQRKLGRYLASVMPTTIKELVHQPGWHRSGTYVTPQGNYPPGDDSLIFNGHSEQVLDMQQEGSPEEWKRLIAAMAPSNKYLMAFLCQSFSALLLPLVNAQTSIMNLCGNSSQGKTTVLIAATSIFGSRQRLKSWRATDNGLEGIAAAANHSFLALDEMGEVNPTIIGKAAYMLGNGKGKSRADRSGDIREIKAWMCAIGSSSEVPLQEIMREGGIQSKAGQEVRVIDIEIDSHSPFGAFQCLHHHATGDDFAKALTEAASTQYGTPALAMIAWIQQQGFDVVKSQVADLMTEFRVKYLPKGADGQVCRVVDRFGLIAAAGELATTAGVTGWEPGVAFAHIGEVFTEWLVNRGGVGAQEENKILDQVTYYFERFGHSRFESLDASEPRYNPSQRAGYYSTENGQTHHYVLSKVFRNEVACGFNTKQVIKVLTDAHILIPGRKENSDVIKSPEKKSERVYHLVNVIGSPLGVAADTEIFGDKPFL